MGTIKVHEFNQDDDDIEITVTCEKPGDFVSQVKGVLSKGEIKKEVLRVIAALKAELIEIEANEEKVRKDASEREKAKKEYDEA